MTLLTPWALSALLLALPILALYFLKRRHQRVVVSSLMLWHRLREVENRAHPFDRFRRHWLLWVQLLALALLALALARPVWRTVRDDGQALVIVLDASASMAAVDVAPSRFEAGKEVARELISELASGDEAMVVLAGPSTRVLTPFTRDRGELRQSLDLAQPSEAEGGLRDATLLALSVARSRPHARVVLISDGGGGGDLSTLPPSPAELSWVKVGRGEDNAGLIAVDLRRAPGAGLERELFLTAVGHGAIRQAELAVYAGETLLHLQTLVLAPGEPSSLVVPLPSGLTGRVDAVLTAEGDKLAADDRVSVVVSPTSARQVLLIGVDSLTERALRADSHNVVEAVAQASPERAAQADVLVYGTAAPADLDGQRALLLRPKLGGPVVLGEPVQQPHVLSWTGAHPLLRYVNLDGVVVAEARAVVDAGGLASLVSSESGPLLLAGERRGGRVVQLAFDPYHSDLPLRVAWPIFLANAMSWLGEAQGEEERPLMAGAPLSLRAGSEAEAQAATATLLTADGERPMPLLVEGRFVRPASTEAVGLLQVQLGQTQRLMPIALLSATETEIRPAAGLALGAGQALPSAAASARRAELWPWLAGLALIVVLLEWWGWHRTRQV